MKFFTLFSGWPKQNSTVSFWKKPLGVFLLVAYFGFSLTMVIPSTKALIPVDSYSHNVYGSTVGHDFKIFYTAGELAKNKDYETIYDPDKLAPVWRAKYNISKEGILHFSYPPTALLMWEPLSQLPHLWAFSIWAAVGTALVFRLLFTLTNQHYLVIAVTCVSPLFLQAIISGQTGFLVTFLLAFGMYQMDRKKPLSAGVCFGLLIFKPHLALALPLCLILRKEWKVIYSGVVTCSFLLALSFVYFDVGVWAAFVENFGRGFSTEHISQGQPTASSLTLWSIALNLTDSKNVALVAHVLGAIFAFSVSIYTWKNTQDYIPRLLTLILFPAFISPYFHLHDLTPLIIIYALMIKNIITIEDSQRAPLIAVTIWLVGYLIFKGAFYSIDLLPPFFLVLLMAYAAILTRQNVDKKESLNFQSE